MMRQEYYLGQNAQFEPLYNGWYAWSHLIPPATAAMNVVNSHLKIMKSYVMAPQVHANSIKNPALRGGPFIDYNGGRVDEIKGLIERTRKQQAHIIKLADAIKELSELLAREARGHSLEPLYPRIPEALRGYVELVYDLNNNPSIRFIEPLLYKSPYYERSLQAISLSPVDKDERSFAFSTPRLEDETQLRVQMPFEDERLDELFKMRAAPRPLGFFKELVGPHLEEKVFLPFLSEKAPLNAGKYNESKVRIRYMGHACILIETDKVSILTDPVLSYDYENPLRRYTYSDLPPVIDYVLITHGHSDHFLLESLLQLRHKIGSMIVPKSGNGALQDPSLKLILQNIGFKNAIEIGELESIAIEGGSITSLPFLGEHADLNINSKTAHLIRVGEKSILCAADSSNVEPELYRHLRRLIGDVDVLFLGMECDGAPLSWIYGQLLTTPLERSCDQSRRLSGSDYPGAMGIVEELNCKEVYVYAMGQEPWLGFVTSIKYTDESKPIVESNKLLEYCSSHGIKAERLFALKALIL